MLGFRSSTGGRFLHFTGLGTELVFRDRVLKPGQPAFTIFGEEGMRDLIASYFRELIDVAREHGAGAVLDAPTWDAHTARGEPFDFSGDDLREMNRNAISDLVAVREECGDLPTVIAAPVGPRDDAYEHRAISVQEAADYHAEQLETLAGTDVDCIDAFTLPGAEEAAGMVRAARAHSLPIVVSFTLNTDGHLPSGMTLEQAIRFVDDATDGYPSYFLVNCIHPDHFPVLLSDSREASRLRGIVANGSNLGHGDLNERDTLLSDDPDDFGRKIAEIGRRFGHFSIFGGCCGTDMRHLRAIARQ